MRKIESLKRVKFAFFSGLVVLALSSHAFAATYYVNGSCSSSGNGTTATCGSNGPWKTLGEAASGVPSNANHTISVAAGTYAGFTDNRSGASAGYRHWLANGSVTITGLVTLKGAYIKFEGFTIANTGTYGLFLSNTSSDHCWILNNDITGCIGAGIILSGTNHIIQGNDISKMVGNGDADGIHMHGSGHLITGNRYHNLLVTSPFSDHIDFIQSFNDPANGKPAPTNCIVEKNYAFMGNDSTGRLLEANSASSTVYGFMLDKANNITIRNNLIYAWGGINTGSGSSGYNNNMKVYNNTFISDINFTHAYGGWGINFSGGSNNVAYNNIFFNFRGTGRGANIFGNYPSTSGGFTENHNLVYNSNGAGISYSGVSPGSRTIDQDPLFVTSYTDLHLQSGSPAKDAGYNLSGTVDNDYEGNSRPQGSGYDIGAYEYSTSTSSPTPPTGLRIVPMS